MRLHRPRVVMQENCDYDSEIENMLLDYEVVGTNGNIVTHTRDCLIVEMIRLSDPATIITRTNQCILIY